MFRKSKKTKKISIENFIIIIFSSCPSFVFVLYTLVSPNLQIILKFFTDRGKFQRGGLVLQI